MIQPQLWRSAVALQRYLDANDFRFCFIGGIALQRWGESRTTDDLDGTIWADFGNEREIAQTILRTYQSRIDNPESFSVSARILLLRDVSNVSIDLALGGMPYEANCLSRATLWTVPGGGSIRTCCAEDLVVLKAFANRPQDWIDIRNVLIRQGNRLDRELIERELSPLVELKEEPEILTQLIGLFQRN
jgi:hypothetical protein